MDRPGRDSSASEEGEDVLARWLAHRTPEGCTGGAHSAPVPESGDSSPEPGGVPTSEERREPEDAPGPVPTAEPRRKPLPADHGVRPAGTPLRVEFAPRMGVRRVVTLVGWLAAVATVVAGYLAWQDRTAPLIGITATLAGLAAFVWAVQVASPPTRLVVQRGVLEVHKGGTTHAFDLASRYLDLEVVGRPGQRGWKVLLHRRGSAPLVIDRTIVDPREFTEVLVHYRPELDDR